jgi:dTDP-4-amino-4,6-dideoxygalactose transaminase
MAEGTRDNDPVKTPVESVPFCRPAIGDAGIREVVATLESGWLTTGPRVKTFEERFAAYTGAPHAIAVSSGTAALHLSLVAAGIGPGDEVITTPMTFCATANAIIHTGATLVFADVDPVTMNLDPAATAAAITSRTRAVLPVHLAGRPADVRAFRALADRHRLTVVEDAAHCTEGISLGGRVGTTGDFTCFSFYATKNLTTGEGGMLTTASAEAAARIRIAALHGMSHDAWARYATPRGADYDVVMPGFKYNMMDVQAAIGLHQLEALDANLERREAIWERYDAGLADVPVTRPAPVEAGCRHARHLYTILVDPDRCGLTRGAVVHALADRGIATSRHFKALHLHTFYAERFGFRRGQFPHAERISDQTVSLPLFPTMSGDEVDAVIDRVRDAVGGRR